MQTEINLQNAPSIKAYFEKVRQLANSGEQYPVNLDEAWPLVYSEKGKAVRVLKKEFFENEDYVLLAQNGKQKNSRGGHNELDYRLSVSCLEFFIARKVRAIFEVYRQVFNSVADQIEAPSAALPATEMELLLQTLQANVAIARKMVETERRVSDLEMRFDRIEQIQQQGQTDLLALPAPSEPLPELSLEDKIKQYVNAYSRAKALAQQEVWRLVYNELYYRYHLSVNSYRLKPGESKLQRLKSVGKLAEVYTVASNILRLPPNA